MSCPVRVTHAADLNEHNRCLQVHAPPPPLPLALHARLSGFPNLVRGANAGAEFQPRYHLTARFGNARVALNAHRWYTGLASLYPVPLALGSESGGGDILAPQDKTRAKRWENSRLPLFVSSHSGVTGSVGDWVNASGIEIQTLPPNQ